MPDRFTKELKGFSPLNLRFFRLHDRQLAVKPIRGKFDDITVKSRSVPFPIRAILLPAYHETASKKHKEECERRIEEERTEYGRVISDIQAETEVTEKLTADLPPECRNPVACHIIQDIIRKRKVNLAQACGIYIRIRNKLLNDTGDTGEQNCKLRDRLQELEQKYDITELRGKDNAEKIS